MLGSRPIIRFVQQEILKSWVDFVQVFAIIFFFPFKICERHTLEAHIEQDDAQGEDICLLTTVKPSFENLWRHVARCA